MKKTLLATLVTLIALPALAAPQKNISAAVEREILQAPSVQDTPLEVFNRQIQTVAEPNAQALLKILPTLTAYNADFKSAQEDSAKRALAFKLEGPIEVPWNTYRGNGLKEIFDNYIPNSHGNQALADLEYYVKFYTVPQHTLDRTYIVSKTLPRNFTNAYDKLQKSLAAATTRNDKELLGQIAAFIPAYNALAAQEPVIARELASSLFKIPLKTGWDRTFSLKDLAFQLGITYYTEGYHIRTAEELQRRFGVSRAEAELFEPFVHAL